MTTRELIRTAAGTLAAQARVVTVRWDPDRRTPIPFTEPGRAALTAVMPAAEA
jgi:acyl-CoA thioesterase FadM